MSKMPAGLAKYTMTPMPKKKGGSSSAGGGKKAFGGKKAKPFTKKGK
jgi:hypothetical protein